MVAKSLTKQETLRIRVYEFFEKNIELGKTYTVDHFAAEQVPRRTIYNILSRRECFPATRKSGSGSIKEKLTQRQINQLIKDFDHKATISQRQAARKFDISQLMVHKILKKNHITCRKKMKIPSRTDAQKISARTKCGNLYLNNRNISWIIDDESYFTLSHSTINGNNNFYTSNIDLTPASVKFNPVKKFEPKLLVWICVSDRGISDPIFRKSGNAVNKSVYIDCIKHGVLPFIRKYHSDGNYKFWPDLASSHYAHEVVDYYKTKNINFVEKSENPANVPEVRPVEDFWSILKAKVYEKGWRAENLNLLKNRIRLCIRKLDLNLIQNLLAGTSTRLDYVRRNDLIENS